LIKTFIMEFKIKEYDLRFIVDKNIVLKHDTIVSLTSTPPTTKEDFYWVDSISDDALGFMYGLYGIDEKYHGGSLYPLLPVIVSNELLNISDLFYVNGVIHEVNGLFMDEEERWKVIDENGGLFYEAEVLKLIATPDQIGWVYNEGPPHDHNYNWVDSRYLEQIHNRLFINCVKNGFKITIAVDEECVVGGEECRGELRLIPMLHEGKAIIDGYGLLKKSSSVFVY